MKLTSFISILIVLFLPAGLKAQMAGEVIDVNPLYRIVLDDFKESGMLEPGRIFGILDSTCPAVYYGGFPDSVNKKYFGYETENYIDGEVFRRSFVESTQVSAILPLALYADTGLIRIKSEVFRKCFSPTRNSGIILTDKGFEKLGKMYPVTSYGEFSSPYFINDHTVLMYFNFQDGLDNVFSNVYLLLRKGKEWVIGARLRGWI